MRGLPSYTVSGHDRSSTTQPAVVVDHPEAAHECHAGIRHGGARGSAGHLSDGLGDANIAASRACLAAGELTARGVDREIAIDGETVRADKLRALPLRAKAEILELHDVDDR